MEPVQVERFYLGCLAHASYMIGSEGVAAVIDPQRDVDQYLEMASAKGWKIEHIIETHLHADFVSGHLELAQGTGARVYFGAGSGARFPHVAVTDGSEIHFGRCRLRFLETPGHTIESICIQMNDLGQPDRPAAVFTGDTLFIGDVGRPDLSGAHTPSQLAEMLYHSLHDKLMPLPDDTEIFPAHGAGSLCGRQMSSESSSTIGRQKQTNYALLAPDCETFVYLLTDNLPAAPEYFAREVDLNRSGAAPVSELPRPAALAPPEVLRYLDDGVAGWIQSGFELDYIPQITGPELVELQQQEPERIAVLDVLEASERVGGTILDSISIPLGKVAVRADELDRNKLLVVHCKGGYRSSIATSLLRRAGFRDVANLTGGFDPWKAAGLPCA